MLGGKNEIEAVPALVALYISTAYCFTVSTNFANPVVTIARTFNDTFSEINYNDTSLFIIAQIIGAVLALMLYLILDRAA